MKITHGQKIIETPNDDGSINIRTEGYFEGLNTVKEQVRQDVQTSYSTLLSDVIKCLDVLKSDTPELVIRITKDRSGSPAIIQKTWIIRKEKIK